MELDLKKLNKEQKEAVVYKKGPLLIVAGAGTGKTTVITQRIAYLIEKGEAKPASAKSYGRAKPEEILAVTFTDKAAEEMEERVDKLLPYGYVDLWISTFHSFCDRILRQEAISIGIDPGYKLMTEAETTKFIRDNLFKFDLLYFRPLGNPTKFITSILQHFSRLKDEDIAPEQYLRFAQELKIKNEKLKIEEEEIIDNKKYMELAKAYRTYEEMKVKEGKMDFADLIASCLKLFRTRKNILKEYRKQFKYILIDEFQDTNIAQYELIKLLAPSSSNPNLTVVGDDNQCLPPEAEITLVGGIKKIKDIKVGDEVLTAVGKGHTSISKVTRINKNHKEVRLLTFKTEDGKKITVTDNHKMFGFLPAHYKNFGWYFVYLMYQQKLGWRVGVTNNLPARLRLELHADKILAIGSYTSDKEARYYEAYYSAKYGLPTIPFSARPYQAISGKWLRKLFKEINTEENIKKLSNDLHLELNSPICFRGAVTRGVSQRVKVNLIMCYRNYRSKTHKNGFVGNPGVLHYVNLETSNIKTVNILKQAGYKLNKTKKGFKYRFYTVDLNKAWEKATELVKLTGGLLDKKFVVGLYNYQHLAARIVPASHIFPGMYLPVLEGQRIVYKKVISRKEQDKKTDIYDLEIDKTHNFIADGIVVHNSIYKFRGAAVSNILSFKNEYPKATTVILNQNYRSTQEILDRAYRLIKNNDPDTLEAKLGISKKLESQRKLKGEEVDFLYTERVEDEADETAKKIKELADKEKYQWNDFAILVRANNHAEPFTRALIRKGIPYQFLGPGMLFKQPEIKNLIAYLKILYNPEDSVSFYKVLTWELFNIPGRDITSLVIYSKRYNLPLFEAIQSLVSCWFENKDLGAYGKSLPFIEGKTKDQLKKLIEIVNRHLGLVPKETAGQILFYFLEDSGLLQKIASYKTEKEEQQAQNISRFFDKLKSYEVEHEDASITAVCDWIDLSLELGESPLVSDTDWTENNAVNLLTVHSSKGLEFPVVFLVNLVSQRFPTLERRERIPIPEKLIKEILPEGDYHLEEERRLFYVGATRAGDHLFLTAANYYGEGKRIKKLSPFVIETLGENVTKKLKTNKDENQLSLFTWKKTEESVKKRTPLLVNYLSYSQIQTFGQCPLHYKLKYILRIPTPPTAALSFGSTIHATMRDFYQWICAGNKASFNELLSFYEKNWLAEGFTNKRHELLMKVKGEKYLRDFLEKSFNEKNLPVALETPFKFPVSETLRFGGKIDRVDKHPSGRIEIVDYKTGGKVPTQKQVDGDLQMTLYALAATEVRDQLFWKKPEEVILSLYYFEEQKKISTVRTKEQLEEAKKTVIKIAKEIESSDFTCSGSEFCRICEYKLFCEAR